MKKRVIWDFDGTIVNSYPLLLKNYRHLFKKINLNIKGPLEDEVIISLLKQSSKELFDFYGIPYKQDYLKILYEYDKKHKPEDFELFPYVKEALERTDINLLITNRNRDATEKLIEHFQLENYFEEIICADDRFPKKPHPGSYEYAIRKFDIDTVVGDRMLDFEPAKIYNLDMFVYRNPHLPLGTHFNDYRYLFNED